MSSAACLPAAAAATTTTTTTMDMHGCRRCWGGGGGFVFLWVFLFVFFLVFFVCISIPHPLPPFLVFSPLPNSSQWTQWPCLQDPVLPSLCAQIRTGETPPLPQDLAFGQLARFWFLINTTPSEERKPGACLDIGWASTAACSVRAALKGADSARAAFHACH